MDIMTFGIISILLIVSYLSTKKGQVKDSK